MKPEKTYHGVLAIPRSGRTFENFIRQLVDKARLDRDSFNQLLSVVSQGKKHKSQNFSEAQEFLGLQSGDVAENLGLFIDRKRESRPFRVGFLSKDFELNGLNYRLEGDEPHNCSSLVALGEADIAIAGWDEFLNVMQTALVDTSVTKWGMYNFNLPERHKLRVAGSAMLSRWNDTLQREIQDFVGFFLIANGVPEGKDCRSSRKYLDRLCDDVNDTGKKTKVFVKGRYVDVVKRAYPNLFVIPVHDVEDAVQEAPWGSIGLEIVQSGNTLRRKNLIIIGEPLFLSESLYVADYYRYNDSTQPNGVKAILDTLEPKNYFDPARLEQFAWWYAALQTNMGENWINRPDIGGLLCTDDEIERGLRPVRLGTRMWTPSNYKEDEAKLAAKEARAILQNNYQNAISKIQTLNIPQNTDRSVPTVKPENDNQIQVLKNISGFPEFSPEAQILFNKVVSVIRDSYESCGAVPIETSAVERVDHILAKGGNDKEIYGLHRLKGDDKESKDYALHFDLTLPLARYVAQNSHRLHFPFKRYQIQPVWRGERAQNKRYRQFYQCDIDVIGDGKLSIMYDAEMPAVIYRIFRALDIGPFIIRINNRKILTGLLGHYGITGDDKALAAINIIDDLEKVGLNSVKERLADIGADPAAVEMLVDFFEIAGSSEEVLKQLEEKEYGEVYEGGVAELRTVVETIKSFQIPEEFFKIDLSIARGLDYYTGTVYETQLVNNPDIGSICSGGRYDNLAENFSNKHLPGVGISIGLSRLLNELIEKGVLSVGPQSVTPVLVTVMDDSHMAKYLEITTSLRDAGIKTELYLEGKKLQKQLAYANKKGIPFAIIAGETEFNKDKVQVKNLNSQTQHEVEIRKLSEYFKEVIV